MRESRRYARVCTVVRGLPTPHNALADPAVYSSTLPGTLLVVTDTGGIGSGVLVDRQKRLATARAWCRWLDAVCSQIDGMTVQFHFRRIR